jgi:hypothetical protein
MSLPKYGTFFSGKLPQKESSGFKIKGMGDEENMPLVAEEMRSRILSLQVHTLSGFSISYSLTAYKFGAQVLLQVVD